MPAHYRQTYNPVNRNSCDAFDRRFYKFADVKSPGPSHLPGKRIAERMSHLSLSQSELARKVGVSQPTIAELIAVEKRSSKHLHRIAAVLQTSPEYLLGETDDPAPTGVVVSAAPSDGTLILMQVRFPGEQQFAEQLRGALLAAGFQEGEPAQRERLARLLLSSLGQNEPVKLTHRTAESSVLEAPSPDPANTTRQRAQ